MVVPVVLLIANLLACATIHCAMVYWPNHCAPGTIHCATYFAIPFLRSVVLLIALLYRPLMALPLIV